MSENFTPTPAELNLVSQVFNQADTQKLGILTGDVAVKVFGGAKLPPSVLGEIWSIADDDNNGWLPRKGVAKALRLIGWAQKGEQITPELVNKPGPPAIIEGFSSVAQHSTGTSAQPNTPGLPPFTAQEKAKFQNLFTKAGPDINGLLNGNKARDIFLKSKLSNDILLQVWNLADTQDRGALDATDFAIAMHFIQALMAGQITSVPTVLPPGLYQKVGGNPAGSQDSIRPQPTGTSGSFSPISGAFPQSRSTLQPQYTGQSHLQPDHTGLSATSSKPPAITARPTITNTASPFGHRNEHTTGWDVTLAEKISADKFFDELDSQRRGYIEGDVAVPFMLKSNLPGEDLARVWDLSDLHGDGKLTRDGFAVAMHLIQRKLTGVEIPNILPPSLVPPSVRSKIASPFSAPFQQQSAPEPTRDLLWDDTPPASATASQPNPETPAARSVSGPAPTNRDPFSSALASSPPHHDLLSDDDEPEHKSTPLQDQSAEIGNTRNQLNSTNRALDTLKGERAQVEERLVHQASQLSSLQNQLSSAKIAYESETKALASLRERYSSQATELQKLTEQLIHAESDLSAVRVEKAEVEGAYMRDKEDTRELQRKMADVGQQIETTKAEVEKAKKDAKQQKGLLAIARKQLSVKEAEKAKTLKELDEAAAEVTSITQEKDEAEAELAALSSTPAPIRADSVTFASTQPLPLSPAPSSPAGSTIAAKSNNPFDKLNKSGTTPQSQSPFLSFGDLSLPSSSTGDAVNNLDRAPSHDPFGFSEAFETDTQSANATIITGDVVKPTSRPSTPKQTTADILSPDSILSPGTEGESEQFMTPPSTATLEHSQSPKAGASTSDVYPASDDAASKFPQIDAEVSQASSPPLSQAEVQTDFGSRLKELDIEESDSDSEDEVPLANLAAKTQKRSSAVPPSVSSTQPESLSFDNAFDVAPTVTKIADRPSVSTPVNQDNLRSPADSQTLNATTGSTKDASGVNAFDEAMWTIPGSSEASKKTFTFDSSFDDNFDFGNAVKEPPLSISKEDTPQIAENPSPTPLKNNEPVFSANGPSLHPSPNGATPKPTFDEAFASFDSSPSLKLDNTFMSSLSKDTAPATEPSPPHVAPSPPTSPAARPTSPTVRTKSPPPRTSSPKPARPSTSSSKETPEKVKDATRHSKLSIRLPFGKKKKQSQPEPLPTAPAQYLTPPKEEPSRTITPALDDDVEAVKQLSAMGFSRSESITALEKYGYDVQRALNSLLGAQ